MRCTVGPIARDDIVTFKIRSRLFTETQIKVRTSNWSYLEVHKILDPTSYSTCIHTYYFVYG